MPPASDYEPVLHAAKSGVEGLLMTKRTDAQLAATEAHGFKPGNNANPGGRPKGLARLVREKTRDGLEATEYLIRVVSGQEPGSSHRDRIEAARVLFLWGWGKPRDLETYPEI